MVSSHHQKDLSKLNAVRDLLANGQLEALLQAAPPPRRLLSLLTALSYDQNPIIAQRAIQAFGSSAALLAAEDPDYVRNHLRRLIWLLSDESGGIGWRAPELLGEALYHCHALFPEYLPILVSLLDMEPQDAPRFQASILRAIGRVAQANASAVKAARPMIQPLLESPDGEIARLADWCLQLLE